MFFYPLENFRALETMSTCDFPCMEGQGACINGSCVCLPGFEHQTIYFIQLDCGGVERSDDIDYVMVTLCLVVMVGSLLRAFKDQLDLLQVFICIASAFASLSTVLMAHSRYLEGYTGPYTCMFLLLGNALVNGIATPNLLISLLEIHPNKNDPRVSALENSIFWCTWGWILGSVAMGAAAQFSFHTSHFEKDKAYELYDLHEINQYNSFMRWMKIPIIGLRMQSTYTMYQISYLFRPYKSSERNLSSVASSTGDTIIVSMGPQVEASRKRLQLVKQYSFMLYISTAVLVSYLLYELGKVISSSHPRATHGMVFAYVALVPGWGICCIGAAKYLFVRMKTIEEEERDTK